MISVNLIPIYRRQQRRLRARRKAWIIIGVIYAIFITSTYGIWHWAWSDDSDLGSQLTRIQEEIDDTNRIIERVGFSLNESRVAVIIQQTVNQQPDWSILLAILADLRGEDVVLKSCVLDAGSETIRERPADVPEVVPTAAPPPAVAQQERSIVRLQGYGRSQAVVAQFVLRLEQVGLFDDVSLVKTNREPFLADHAMSFQIDCQLKAGAADAKRDAKRDVPSRRVAGINGGGNTQ